MTHCRTIALTGLAGLLLGASIAAAEPLEMKRPPWKQDRVAPSTADRDLRPSQPAVPFQPGFLAPLTRETQNGRVGAAGWTSPSLPSGSRGAAEPESSGVFGFGLAVERGTPRPPDKH